MPELRIELPDIPYRFDLLLEIVKRFAFPARQIVSGDQLWRVTHGQLVAYAQIGDHLEICSQPTDNDPALITTSRHILGLNRSFSEFYQYAESKPILWETIQPLVGLPIFCTESIFEALITLIIEQHISWKNALRSQQVLMQICQTGQTHGDITVYDFPSPQQLSQMTSEQLKPLKITNRRIDMIIQIAKDVVSGELDLESITTMSTEEAYESLLKIKGVGHWTANNVLSRALGVFPYISHNDVALQAAIQHYFYDNTSKKSAQQTIETLEAFGDYAGLAGHFTLLRWVLDQYPIVH